MGIFDRLNYGFNETNSGINDLSSNTKSFMNTVPSLLNTWQKEDIANDTVGGYFKNPVATVTQNIRNTCNTLTSLLSAIPSANTNAVSGTTSQITTLFNTINSQSANVGGHNGGVFIEHTNRISGVTPYGASPQTGQDTSLLPHYETAMSTGQLMMYLVYQSDNVQNNAPIMGSFTSMLIEDKLNSLNSNISSYYTTISNSITVSGSGLEEDPYIRQSNLSLSVVQSMSNNILTINSTLADRRVHDEVFYTNSRQVSDEYAQLRMFSDLGSSANTLLQNFNGSDKLLTRLNS
jgi:hypothetical protein